MNSPVNKLFPTPVYMIDLVNPVDIQSEITQILPSIPMSYVDGWGQSHLLSTRTFDNDLISEFKLTALEKCLSQHLTQFCKDIDYDPGSFTRTSWMTKFDRGNYGHIHHHGVADISGVYYYKTNGQDGDLFFESPLHAGQTSILFRTDRIKVAPLVGRLLLFPGWLQHGIITNLTDNQRISISFNITFSIRK
jgi:uncharacterized protein (TIGR02466 family)